MDTVVESPMVQQPPVGEQHPINEQQLSASPTGSRKRTFHEANGVAEGDVGIEPQDKLQISASPGGEDQVPLDGLPPNGPAPTTPSLPPVAIGTGNGPVEAVSLSTNAASNPAAAAAPIPIPTPKTPISFPTMPNKKLKLSPASLEAKRIEKEIRDRQRAEEKVKKEEEKRVREEEKKKREEEREEEKKKREEKREEKRKVREEERLARDGEKRKKEEEKLKKERVSAILPHGSGRLCDKSMLRLAIPFKILILPVTNEIKLLLRQACCL